MNLISMKYKRAFGYSIAHEMYQDVSNLNLPEGRPVKETKSPIEAKTSMDKTFVVNLQLVGIGYRAYVVNYHPEDETNSAYSKFLVLKVGQSGSTVYPIPDDLVIKCPVDAKADKEPIMLMSDNLNSLSQAVAEIKSYRKPDPYKGGGILECTRAHSAKGEIFVLEKILRKEIKKKNK